MKWHEEKIDDNMMIGKKNNHSPVCVNKLMST